MTAPLLFCTAGEAKPIVYKVVGVKLQGVDESLFYLVESRAGPQDGARPFKKELAEGEILETDFIGVSESDCQTWALDMQDRHNFIEQDLIGPGVEIGDEGIFPKDTGKWYDFRINYRDADLLTSSLSFGAFDVVYPVYFGRKEELTDERGIFDVSRAEKLSIGEDA
ncbi:hypothetical protein EKO27_g1724 [Xylaria grammica]|uniref:Uncharacterized protein n=1 Tax=Xylaria grammica TaxID=363999 RepID=A0A439DG45_9PEZI|nr:hypothetical protein EKO27_g1724 [Xylaria grammica]